MPLYLLRVSLEHLSFRIPSLLSVAQRFGFPIKFKSTDLERGVLVVVLEEEDHVQKILDRGTLVLFACELYATASSYDELHSTMKQKVALFDPYRDQSFKFSVEASNYRIPTERQVRVATSFPYLQLQGRINLSNPEVEYVVFEDYDWGRVHNVEMRLARDGTFKTVYFARRIGFSRARPLVVAHSVKTREYYGNTSMESEMGFLMAGQALPGPNKLIYDPFAGTCSLLYACAHFGAMVFGSDIDARQMRGKVKGKGVVPGMLRAAAQYGVADKFLDCLTYDVTQNPLRRGSWIDAIITDPPYGVRAGAKRLGKKESKKPAREEPFMLADGRWSHEVPGYLPPSRPYEMRHLVVDVIRLARYLLVPRGRLVFFLPTFPEETNMDVPMVEGMKELKWGQGSMQNFGRWGRRLITMEKTADDDGSVPSFDDYSLLDEITANQQDFRDRYFAKAKEDYRSRTAEIKP